MRLLEQAEERCSGVLITIFWLLGKDTTDGDDDGQVGVSLIKVHVIGAVPVALCPGSMATIWTV